jgi:hypothetical protein
MNNGLEIQRQQLQGAVEVAPEMVHPQSQVTLEALWHRVCHGPRKVLWLASDQQKSDEARRLRAKLSSTSEGLLAAECDAWEITVHPHTSIEQLKRHPIVAKDYSLLLYSGGGQSLNDAARWFGGPLLNLSNCESTASRESVRDELIDVGQRCFAPQTIEGSQRLRWVVWIKLEQHAIYLTVFAEAGLKLISKA